MKTAFGIFAASSLALFVTGCSDDPGAAVSDAGERWVAGALHVHSTYSDGAGSVAEIAAAARSAGLDFVILTDHWSQDALETGEEAYYDGVLVLVGVEATTNVGHVLGFDLPATPMRFGRRNAREVLKQIQALDGFAMVAHPDSARNAFSWRGWDLAGYEGFELFNAYSAYTRKGTVPSLAYLLLHPYLQTPLLEWKLGWNPELTGAWDGMLDDRRLAAWAGSDAHGGIELAGGYFLRWPSYAQVFRMARNHLWLDAPLTGSVEEDSALIYRALRAGHGYVSLGDGNDGSGFRFWAEGANGEVGMGGDLEPGEVTFHASSPVPEAELQLFRNGTLVGRGRGSLAHRSRSEGLYRVEATLPVTTLGGEVLQPWIVSNPIAVFPAEHLSARLEANVLPPPEPWVVDMARVTDYPVVLNIEPVRGCRSLEMEGGYGHDWFQARFALGIPPRGARDTMNDPWGRCTLADRRSQDLTGFAGVRFDVRSDAIYRVTLAMSDAETIGVTSFLTDLDWTEVAIPFSELGRGLDLARISQFSFFFDTSNTIPGTDGVIEVRGINLVPDP